MKNKFHILIIGILTLFSCEKEQERLSILGAWNVEESSEIGQKKYQVSIMRDYYFQNDTSKYIINNFYNIGNSELMEVYVTKEHNNTLIITGCASVEYAFEGEGVISDDMTMINWEYTVYDGLTNPHVNARYY